MNRNNGFGSVDNTTRAMSNIPKTPRLSYEIGEVTNNVTNSTLLGEMPNRSIYIGNSYRNIEDLSSYRNRVLKNMQNNYYGYGDHNLISESNYGKEVVPIELLDQDKEVVLNTKPKTGSRFTLVFRLLDDNLNKIEKVLVKYHGLSKRKIMWNLWEKDRSKYGTYAEFKQDFNPNSSIFRTILKETKSDISKEIRALINSNNPFGTSRIEYPSTKRIEYPRSIGLTNTQRDLNYSNGGR